jgi:hypothetical protein
MQNQWDSLPSASFIELKAAASFAGMFFPQRARSLVPTPVFTGFFDYIIASIIWDTDGI